MEPIATPEAGIATASPSLPDATHAPAVDGAELFALLWQRLTQTQREQADHARAVGRALIEIERGLHQRLDGIETRLSLLERISVPASGELGLADGYQLIVNELADVKTAVVALQRGAREDAAPDPPLKATPKTLQRH